MSLHVVLAGGGTAGHVEPALALADALRRRDPLVRITALGTERGLESRLVPERGYDLALVPAVPVPRRPGRALALLPGRLRRCVRETEEVLARTGADVVVGFGGFVAGPAYLAARRRRVPIVVHEANARPGLANRLGARLAAAVATATPGTGLPGAVMIGMPLRRSISLLDRAAARAEGRSYFGLAADLPVLLVFGGSLGARRLNTAVPAAAAALAAAGVQVLHATGAPHLEEVRDRVGGLEGYHVVPYLDRMDLAYAAADLALSRSGATTCAELAAVGLPAVLVPLPIGNGEQRLNAEALVGVGGALVVADAALDAAAVRSAVLPLITDASRLTAMARAAGSTGHRDADETLADITVSVVDRHRTAGTAAPRRERA